jgi:hypothetical protein
VGALTLIASHASFTWARSRLGLVPVVGTAILLCHRDTTYVSLVCFFVAVSIVAPPWSNLLR